MARGDNPIQDVIDALLANNQAANSVEEPLKQYHGRIEPIPLGGGRPKITPDAPMPDSDREEIQLGDTPAIPTRDLPKYYMRPRDPRELVPGTDDYYENGGDDRQPPAGPDDVEGRADPMDGLMQAASRNSRYTPQFMSKNNRQDEDGEMQDAETRMAADSSNNKPDWQRMINNATSDADMRRIIRKMEDAGISPPADIIPKGYQPRAKTSDTQDGATRMAMNDGGDPRIERKVRRLTPAASMSSDPNDWQNDVYYMGTLQGAQRSDDGMIGPKANDNRRRRN